MRWVCPCSFVISCAFTAVAPVAANLEDASTAPRLPAHAHQPKRRGVLRRESLPSASQVDGHVSVPRIGAFAAQAQAPRKAAGHRIDSARRFALVRKLARRRQADASKRSRRKTPRRLLSGNGHRRSAPSSLVALSVMSDDPVPSSSGTPANTVPVAVAAPFAQDGLPAAVALPSPTAPVFSAAPIAPPVLIASSAPGPPAVIPAAQTSASAANAAAPVLVGAMNGEVVEPAARPNLVNPSVAFTVAGAAGTALPTLALRTNSTLSVDQAGSPSIGSLMLPSDAASAGSKITSSDAGTSTQKRTPTGNKSKAGGLGDVAVAGSGGFGGGFSGTGLAVGGLAGPSDEAVGSEMHQPVLPGRSHPVGRLALFFLFLAVAFVVYLRIVDHTKFLFGAKLDSPVARSKVCGTSASGGQDDTGDEAHGFERRHQATQDTHVPAWRRAVYRKSLFMDAHQADKRESQCKDDSDGQASPAATPGAETSRWRAFASFVAAISGPRAVRGSTVDDPTVDSASPTAKIVAAWNVFTSSIASLSKQSPTDDVADEGQQSGSASEPHPEGEGEVAQASTATTATETSGGWCTFIPAASSSSSAQLPGDVVDDDQHADSASTSWRTCGSSSPRCSGGDSR